MGGEGTEPGAGPGDGAKFKVSTLAHRHRCRWLERPRAPVTHRLTPNFST